MLGPAECQEELLQAFHVAGTVCVVAPSDEELRRARVFAEVLGRAIDEFNAKATNAKRVKVDASLSRILDNDPERKRTKRSKRSRPTVDPGIFTVMRYARQIGVTVGSLLGESPAEITDHDREWLREMAARLTEIAGRAEKSSDGGHKTLVPQTYTSAPNSKDDALRDVPLYGATPGDADASAPRKTAANGKTKRKGKE